MWFRRKSDQLLNEPRRLSTADYLCKLMEEQNSLLRELLRAMGRNPATIRSNPVTASRVRTDADVFVLTPEMRRKQTEEQAEKAAALWRSGRDSEATASTSGPKPNGQESAPEASNPKPSAL